MLAFLALLPCLLVAADASAACTPLLQCQNLIAEPAFSNNANMMAYIEESQVMDAVCAQAAQLTSCVNTHNGACDDDTVKDQLKSTKDILTYMCSPSGRAVVTRLASSSCASSPLMEVQFETLMQSCLETFQFDVQMEALNAAFAGRELAMSDFCPFVDQLKTCLVRGSEGMCGADMGTFVSDVWDIAARDQFAEFGCTTSIRRKRDFMKRALPLIAKHTALLHKLKN